MAGSNELIVGASGLATVLIGGYTAYTGYRSKGKDQHLALTTTSYDQLQEDNRSLREQLVQERTRGNEERSQADGYHRDLIAQQDVRHELRSILRQAFWRLGEAKIDYQDLADRARATER